MTTHWSRPLSCTWTEYTLDGEHCKRQVPTALAVPITYNHTASTYEVFTNSTTTLYSATLAVHTIRALFRATDQSLLGITDDSDIDDDPEPWHLSIAAKIGIGIGVTIFGLLSIAALVFLFFRARQKRRDRLKGRSHEMSSMRSSTRGRPFSEMGWSAPPRNAHGHHDQQRVVAARGTDMAHDLDGAADEHSLEDSDSGNTAAQEEIRVLMAQKAAIQRRIEELERSENECGTQTPTLEK
ncbi:hypothetical protein ESCO_000889 [Escovopsis weberi]|uniref:Uncharacterized protein n=1 Tax=Escovopsis weberi TaxID=150374 RepID=A0A0M8MUC7_ESCWE|nr:hypothetical protein ESCO_000889 [Escovopsis weberi]